MKVNKIAILYLMFIVSLLIRLFFTYIEFNKNGLSNWADAKAKLEYGHSISKGDYPGLNNDYGYMISAPAIPMIVALSELLTGDPIWPVLIFNCLLSALMVFVYYKLGSKVINSLTGFVMAAWSIFNFSFIMFNFQVLKEPFIFAFFPLVILFCVNVYKGKRTVKNTILSSTFFSLLVHTDERFFVYAPVILIFILFLTYDKHKIACATLWVSILVITMIPWTIVNYKHFNEVVILSPRTTAFTSKLWGRDLGKLHLSSSSGESAFFDSYKEKARIAEEIYGIPPRKYGNFEKYYKAFIHFWKPTYFKLTYIMYGNRPIKWSLVHNINSILFYGIYLPFYITGIFYALWRKKWLIFFLGSLPVIHSIIHTIMVWPLERYRMPVNFLIVIVALWFVNEICSYLKLARFSERIMVHSWLNKQ